MNNIFFMETRLQNTIGTPNKLISVRIQSEKIFARSHDQCE